jgi:hypothetical protein
LDFAFGVDEPEGLCPFDGGTLELPGVFGGRPSLAPSSATRAASRVISAASAESRITSAMSSSFRAISAAIRASLSAVGRSEGWVTRRLTHIRRQRAIENAQQGRTPMASDRG